MSEQPEVRADSRGFLTADWRTERVAASKANVNRLEAFNGRRLAALAVAIGLALVAFGVTRIINAYNRRADKAVACRELGNLYDMAAIGPTHVSDDWQDDSLVSAELVAEHGDEVGVKATPSQMMISVIANHPSWIRWFARNVGCPAATFPELQVLRFDTAPSEPIEVASGTAAPAAVLISLPGAELPLESVVVDTMRDITLQQLVDMGTPIDKMPFLDTTQARLAGVGNTSSPGERHTILVFATSSLDEVSQVVTSVIDAAAALPEMRNATVTSRQRDFAAIEAFDGGSEISVRVYGDQTSGGIDYVQITRRETGAQSMELPSVLEPVASYASTTLEGAPFTLVGWSTGVGRFAALSRSALHVEFAETLEPVMAAIAARIGAIPADGSPQFHDELIDPHRSQYTWAFSRHGDVTNVMVSEDLSDG